MFQTLRFTIEGVSPLLMHNGQTADPLNVWSKAIKAITSKRKKTDADIEELARIEWFAGLYLNEEQKPIIPSTNLESMLEEGAKVQKLGKQFKSAISVDQDAILAFPNQRKAEDLWGDDNHRDARGVRVGQSRVIRNRPIFRQWSCSFDVNYDDEQVNASQIATAIADAGRQKGIMDYRPKFGRFRVVE